MRLILFFYFLFELMKKNTIKAFTLVEMLIVIVIIGILIAALMPRMQAAQWRARDVARKTALSQVQSAIVVWQWDNWKWPWDDAATGMMLSGIDAELRQAGLNWIPKDPLWETSFTWLNDKIAANSQYQYMVTTRNWTPKGWFILMAKTEVAWWSNWVYCGTAPHKWQIKANDDLKNIVPCETIVKSGTTSCTVRTWGTCYYSDDGQLRYIVSY